MRSTAFYERAISYNRCTNKKKNDERRERENEKARKRGCCVRSTASETESGEISNPFDTSALLYTLSTNPGDELSCSRCSAGPAGSRHSALFPRVPPCRERRALIWLRFRKDVKLTCVGWRWVAAAAADIHRVFVFLPGQRHSLESYTLYTEHPFVRSVSWSVIFGWVQCYCPIPRSPGAA